MKKVFGILFLIVGIVSLPSVIAPNAAEMIGRLIGLSLFSFIPAYFLLRKSGKKQEDGSKDKGVKPNNQNNSNNEEGH